MSKTNVAVFAQDPKTAAVVMTGAVALTGAGSIADTANAVNGTSLLLTAGTEGAIVTRLNFMPRGTITATIAYLFLRRASDPAASRIFVDQVSLPAVTVSTTAAATKSVSTLATEVSPLRLGAGDELYVGMSVAASVGVAAYAEFTDF